MKTLAKILATLFVGSVLATATVAYAAPKMTTKTTTVKKVVKKKGYVHAHTFVKKNGTVVHVKGHYRHHPKTKTVVKVTKTTKTGGKMGGMKMGGAKKTM